MQHYHCPHCGRFLVASDAPPGYKLRPPKCGSCKQTSLLNTGRDAVPPSQVASASARG